MAPPFVSDAAASLALLYGLRSRSKVRAAAGGVFAAGYWVLKLAACLAEKLRLPFVRPARLTTVMTRAAGAVHYELLQGACPEGPVVVLLHGFSTPSFVFGTSRYGVLPWFLARSRLVLRYDHPGRGWSDRPQVKYNDRLHVEALRELLDGLDIREPVVLVGYSMGGCVAASFVHTYVARVRAAALLAPAGLEKMSIPLQAVRYSGTAPLLMSLLLPSRLRAMLSHLDCSDDPLAIPKELMMKQWEETACLQGYYPALASSFGGVSLYDGRGSAAAFAGLRASGIPTVVVWGSADEIVSAAGALWCEAHLPTAEVIVVSDSAHQFVVTEPTKVTQALAAWWERQLRSPGPMIPARGRAHSNGSN
eukprot:TRINITY_DN21914_c0_g1_i1.p1 TRINITY_DN21914_c0_g1~~TRINITY_DN21914_c0_g1_i1.p1  ORF type:complete len:364 (+),score=53.46 TRINITY_DN21914_c0_g1_i1:47-1138(+)